MFAMDRLFLAVFMVVLVPTYLYEYGVQNFLWLSDIALVLIFLGLWFTSSLLISVAALLTLFLEISWSIDFIYQLFTGNTIINLASYMFDQQYSLFLRGLSLFHLLLPIFSIKYLLAWGYHKKAVNYAIPLYWVVLTVCYAFTSVDENINWVYLPQAYNWVNMPSLQWLLMQLVLYPLLIMLPKNLFFKKIFKNAKEFDINSNRIKYKNTIIRHMPPKTLQTLQTWLRKAG
jgi:hypothetical protein